jgi:uncharacterized protein YndB with AHSA1/START domain
MTTHDTTIEVDEKVPLVRITRIFDATPDKVYRAHVDPGVFVQWIGPRSLSSKIDYFDARTGGSWRYLSTRDGFDAAFRGCFHELRPNELIIQTFTYEGFPDGVALEKLAFEDLGNGQTRLVGTSLVDSFEDRDAFIAGGMEHGLREGYEKLEELLTANPTDDNETED